MAEKMTFEVFCSDPQLIGEPISKPWVTFYAAMDGLPLDEEGIELFRVCTGRDRYEPRVYTEASAQCGRRSEKTSSALKYLLFKSQFAGWEHELRSSWFAKLARHTRLLRIPIIAQSMRTGRDIARTLESLVMNSPILSKEVSEANLGELTFRNGICFTVLPASKASTRSMTCPGGLLDEYAWVQVEGASDVELVRQIRPSMISFGQSRRLIKCTTPWLKSGLAFSEYSERHRSENLLVWQASTQTMTPRISVEELERERAADPTYFAREYEAQFTDDLEAFLPAADIDAAVQSWTELPPSPEPFYVAALDASGLTGGDAFTFGIGHGSKEGFVVDILRGWKRAAVPMVCDEMASVCKLFRIRNVIGDQYSFSFLSELMRQREIGMEQLTFSARSKPEIYFDLKNMLGQGKIQLPNHAEMIRELRALESTRTSGGHYKICAPRGMHDDFATVLAILANKAKRSKRKVFMPEVLTIRIGAPSTPAGWRDPHEGVDLKDPFQGGERFWHKL